MAVNGKSSTTMPEPVVENRSEWLPTSFRMPELRRKVLDAVSAELGHEDRGETIRQAVDEFIARHFASKGGT